MKISARCLFLSALTLVAASGYSTQAHAYDMSGKFGIGGQQTLTGYTGVHGKYFFNKHWSADLSLGFHHFKPDEGDAEVTAALVPGFNYWIIPDAQAGALQAHLGVGGRLGFVVGKTRADQSILEIDIEAPVIAEIFFGPHFSLAPEFGLVIRMPVGEYGYDQDKGFGVDLGQNTGLFGAGSFNFYF